MDSSEVAVEAEALTLATRSSPVDVPAASNVPVDAVISTTVIDGPVEPTVDER